MFDLLDYKSIFNQRADSYHKAMLKYPDARDEEFQLAIEELTITSQMVLLDIPAGGGYIHKYLPKDIQLRHIETSEVFADLCHSGSPYQIDICELEQLPFDDNSVDAIVSVAGMHHIEDKTAFFAEIYRVLKPSGQFVLADAEESSFVANFLDGWMGQHNSMGHKGWFYDSQMQTDLLQAGLLISKVENKDYGWNFSTIDEAAEYAKLLFGIDQATLEEVAEALEKYLGFNTKKPATFNWQLQFITGSKPE